MQSKTVQERLSTEPKEQPQEALRFAITFEEGIRQQKNFVGRAQTDERRVRAKG